MQLDARQGRGSSEKIGRNQIARRNLRFVETVTLQSI
jgi:hypothetical protein